MVILSQRERALNYHGRADQWARLVADRGLVPTAVEEILRFVSPVANMRRTVTSPVELHGRRLEKGERVVMWYPAANRDESVFGPTAEEFDIVKMIPAINPTHDNPGTEIVRLRAKPEPGRAMTFVVTGHSRETMRLLTFIDR